MRWKSRNEPTSANASAPATRASTRRVARGFAAVALARKGNAQESFQAFKESLPVLLTVSGSGGDDDSGSTAAAREGRIRFIIEAYLRLLSRNPSLLTPAILDETFGYSDVLRGQSVQRALQASSARSATQDPVLAQLIRASQDADKQIGAAVATLNNMLTLPTSERDEKAFSGTEAEIARLQADARADAQGYRRQVPELRTTGQSAAAHARRSPEAAYGGRGADLVLFRPLRQLRVGAAQGRARFSSRAST